MLLRGLWERGGEAARSCIHPIQGGSYQADKNLLGRFAG
jgi:hypothetical protein